MTLNSVEMFYHTMTKAQYFWLIKIVFIFLLIFAINVAQNVFYHRVEPILRKTHKIWDDVILQSIHRPLKFLIWLYCALSILEILRLKFNSFLLFEMLDPMWRVGTLLVFYWFCARFIRRIAERLVMPEYRKKPLDRTTVDIVAKLVVLSMGVIFILIIMQEFNVNITGALVFSGGSALVVGWAAKDLLANFFGGMMIFLDRPFSVGDWIRSPDKELEGTVEQIGWRLTRIRTFDKRPLYIPNSIFSNVAIENPSRMTNRRIKTIFGIRYCDAPKLSAIVTDVDAMLKKHPEIDKRQTTFVRLVEFGASSLNIQIYTFTKTTNWVKFQAIQEDVFLKVIDIVYNKYGASMAFPTRTLEMPHGLDINAIGNLSALFNAQPQTSQGE